MNIAGSSIWRLNAPSALAVAGRGRAQLRESATVNRSEAGSQALLAEFDVMLIL
jgi:hypothetical protein